MTGDVVFEKVSECQGCCSAVVDSSFFDEGVLLCCCWEAMLAKEFDKRAVDAGVKGWNQVVSESMPDADVAERESSWNTLEEPGICNVKWMLLLQKVPCAEQENAGCRCD